MHAEDVYDTIRKQNELSASCHEDDSHHHHGCVMVDLDEAVHGLYAGTKYAIEGTRGSSSQLGDMLGREADRLSHQPLGWMRDQALAHDASEMAAALGLGAVMLPLSAMAIHAGIHETAAARRTHARLKGRAQAITAMQDRLNVLEDTAAGHLSRVQQHAYGHALEEIRHDRRLNTLDGGAGVSSLVSGTTIAAKVAEEIGVKTGLAIAAKSVQSTALVSHSGVACGVATSAGIASQVVLAPLAGLSATALGLFFARHSQLSKRRLKADIAHVQRAVGQLDPSELSPQAQRYQAFLTIKLAQRDRFQRRYHDWNLGFVSGSTAYTASAAAKAGIGIAAMAGASVATGPIGMGALLGVGVAGALTMGVSAHQYLLGHGKKKRYQGYEHADLPGIDRQFLVIVDALAKQNHPRAKDAAANGFELRAALYAHIDGQEKALSDLLRQAADGQKKHYSLTKRSTDATVAVATARQQVAWHHQAKAYLHASAVYSHERLHHSHQEARQHAAHVFGKESATMTAQSLAAWLDQPRNAAPQIAYMTTVLEGQQAYLRKKIATHHQRVQLTQPDPLGSDATPEERACYAERFHAQALLTEQLHAGQELDVATLRRTTRALADLKRTTDSTEQRLQNGRAAFLSIQYGQDGAVTSDAAHFARFCCKDAGAQTSAMRGTLLATEIQAGRLADYIAQQPL